MSLRGFAKDTFLSLARVTGTTSVVRRSNWRRRRLAILCYHGVSLTDEHLWDPELYMSRETLESRLQLLHRMGCPVLSLAEGLTRLRDGTLPAGAVSLTFDDGAHDFFAVAQPLLRKYAVPATVYLTTFYADFQRPVFNVFVSYLLWKAGRQALELGELIPGATTVSIASRAARAAAVQRIKEFVERERYDATAKDDLLRATASLLGVGYDELAQRRLLHIMSHEEIRQLAVEGVDFQLHTHRHRTPRDKSLFLREIDDNRERLEALTKRSATHFCYPSGVYYPEYLAWLREAGVVSAVTGNAGLAQRTSQPLLLPRIVDTEIKSARDFEGRVSGSLEVVPMRWRGGSTTTPG